MLETISAHSCKLQTVLPLYHWCALLLQEMNAMDSFASAVYAVMCTSFSSQIHKLEQASSQQLPKLEAEAQLHPCSEAAPGKLAEVCQPAQQAQAPIFLSIAVFLSKTSKIILHPVDHCSISILAFQLQPSKIITHIVNQVDFIKCNGLA